MFPLKRVIALCIAAALCCLTEVVAENATAGASGPQAPTYTNTLQLHCSALNPDNTRALTNKTVAKRLTVWVCAVTNDSADNVTIWESSALSVMDHLNPVDHVALGVIADDAALRSVWSRGTAGLGAADAIVAYLLANKTFRVGTGWIVGATAAQAVVPTIWEKVRGQAPPVQSKVAGLAWIQPLQLGPGETSTVHVFSQLWKVGKDTTQEFAIDLSKRPMVRSVK